MVIKHVNGRVVIGVVMGVGPGYHGNTVIMIYIYYTFVNMLKKSNNVPLLYTTYFSNLP